MFDETYTHFDSTNVFDREFVMMMKQLGPVYAQMQKNVMHTIALKNAKQWIKGLCSSMEGDENKQKRNDMMETLLNMMKEERLASPYN